jgi:hypothetical protein
MWLAVRKNDHVASFHLYWSVRLAEDEAFAFGEDMKQHYTLRIRQDD